MAITSLQFLGFFLVYSGGYCLIKGKIDWSVEAGPSSGRRRGLHIDLTPDKLKYKRSGVYTGKLVRPIGATLCVVGLLLIFVFPGDQVAFTI